MATSVHLAAGFAIDATEVTRGQYAAWLATFPPTDSQAAGCSENGTFVPNAACMAKPSVCAGAACARHPQPCVDACDATAYCEAIGRRLCTDDGWTSACSADGLYQTVHGANFGGSICNDYTANGSTTVPVASKTDCQSPASGFAGVYDLIGNLEELVDNCDLADGTRFICKPRGLPFGFGAAAPICSQSTYADKLEGKETVGFRCCAD